MSGTIGGSGSSLMDALTNPGVDALMGMAQGFGQAAMPTRMPIPFGSALGMGAGGALSGIKQSQALQLGQQQLQSQRLQNQVAQSALPVELARNNAMAGMWGNPQGIMSAIYGPGGSPFGAQSAAPQSPLPPPAPGGAPSSALGSATTNALSSLPNDNMRSMAVNAAMRAGLPAEAIAPWIATIHTESGWNPNAPDNKDTNGTTDAGIGQVNSSNWGAYGLNADNVHDPAANLAASAQIFKSGWKGDPSAAMGAYNGPAASSGYIGAGAQRLAQWGYPGMQPQASPAPSGGSDPASSGIPGTQPQGAGPSGPMDTTAAAAMAHANQLMDLAKSNQYRIATAKFAGLPAPMVQDPAALIAEAQQYRGLALDRMKLITTRAGVFDPSTGQEVYRQPEYHELQDPNTGQEYPAFVQPGENGNLNVMGGPPGANGSLPPSKLGPGQEDLIKHLADQYANEDKLKYEGATSSILQLDQQDNAISQLNQGGGWSATGMGADAKMAWAKGINSAFQTLGMTPPMNPLKVSSWEDANKIQTQLAFAQAKQLGSREAAQIINMSRVATPGAENTPMGYAAISGGYHEMMNRETDMYNYKTNWINSHGGNLIGAETSFNNQFTPTMYAERAKSVVAPVKITTMDQNAAMSQMSHYLPGTIVTLPNGKTTMVPPRPGVPSVPSYVARYVAGAPNASP